ncbi:MAG: lipoyl(octanoyl) transferase LipB [Gammaproteobacteria bacterium]|nr:lipoyl(octanoyl) transferase LipB [Gammaproteobacteria bacterium]
MSEPSRQLTVRQAAALVDYQACWDAMREFTLARGEKDQDELWLLQHSPVYTLGLSCREAPARRRTDIPLVFSDRGGQITYHGPGQWVLYPLMDLRRRNWGIKRLVTTLEQGVIDLLANYGIRGQRREHAPGVYVSGRKIASLGLRVRNGCSYHGVSLNVAPDLDAFAAIDACGYPDLEVTGLARLGEFPMQTVARDWLNVMLGLLDYTAVRYQPLRLPDPKDT